MIRRNGFTLIELIVVISIVIVVLSMSVSFLGTLRQDAVKHSAQIVKATFMRTSQLASSQRRMHFILFDKAKAFMSIYEDTDEDNEFKRPIDKQVGETIALSKGVFFSDKTSLFQRAESFVTFNSNGSISLPVGVTDAPLDPPEEADIIIEQKDRRGKMYLDFSITTGQIRRMIYRED
ncbi:MAG: prepilin-type N-terminal cleavage/methylation domain-containing protein [Planctomycetota bacterium]|nr:prepilin-type N-terminal cleavage/methylation domain-containing protein [Planctomycetota bacterium]MDI6787218.1 prepilin-type N-terminal cleavage/methylation domain-containing protein [Planctomycetota bacterium]